MQKSEVIDLSNPNAQCDMLDDYPQKVMLSTGALLQNDKPLICGGWNDQLIKNDKCNIIGHEGQIQLQEKRAGASSIVIDEDTLWITGGVNNDGHLKTTELVNLKTLSSIPGPDLPIELAGHCMVKLNERTVIVIGGENDNGIVDKTFLYNIDNPQFEVRSGPTLNLPRDGPGCGAFDLNGKLHLVVASGAHANETTEIWNTVSGKGWEMGNKL